MNIPQPYTVPMTIQELGDFFNTLTDPLLGKCGRPSLFMPYYFYIIQSQTDESYYIGTSRDLTERIERHNQGRSKYTKSKRPWNLVYVEEHPDRSSAMKREYAIKRRKSKDYLANLIEKFSSG
jgi:putative endonuclease